MRGFSVAIVLAVGACGGSSPPTKGPATLDLPLPGPAIGITSAVPRSSTSAGQATFAVFLQDASGSPHFVIRFSPVPTGSTVPVGTIPVVPLATGPATGADLTGPPQGDGLPLKATSGSVVITSSSANELRGTFTGIMADREADGGQVDLTASGSFDAFLQ